jgi:hypothetical protein
VKVHSLTLSRLFALPGACDVTPGSTSRPATSQPPCLGRKPNARVVTHQLHFPKKYTSTSSKTLKKCNYSHGFWVKCVLWWPFIGFWYNYPFVKLVIYLGSFRSFVVLHQESGWLAHDSQLGINRMIFSKKSRLEAMHIDSSIDEPNASIMNMKNYRQHNLHLVVNGQSQWCSLIQAAQCVTIVYDNHKWCHYNHPCHCRCLRGACNIAHLFHEWGLYILDEFLLIYYS